MLALELFILSSGKFHRQCLVLISSLCAECVRRPCLHFVFARLRVSGYRVFEVASAYTSMVALTLSSLVSVSTLSTISLLVNMTHS